MTLKQQIEKKVREFEEKFPIGGEFWVLKRHREEVKYFLSQALHDIAVAAVEEVGVGDDIEFKDKVGNWNLQKAITYQKGYLKCFNILAAKKAEIIKKFGGQMKAYIKKDTKKSDALWLLIERSEKPAEVEKIMGMFRDEDTSDNVAYPLLSDEVELIRDAANEWLSKN